MFAAILGDVSVQASYGVVGALFRGIMVSEGANFWEAFHPGAVNKSSDKQTYFCEELECNPELNFNCY